MQINRKVRQHHTWQHYLRRWGTSNEIFRLSKQYGDINKRGIRSVAFEKNFYETEDLTADDAEAAARMCRELGKRLPERYSQLNNDIAQTVLGVVTVRQHLSTARRAKKLDGIRKSTVETITKLDDYVTQTEQAGLPCDLLRGLGRKLRLNLHAIETGHHDHVQEILDKFQQNHGNAQSTIYNLGESFESANEEAELKAHHLNNLAEGDPSFLREPDEFESFVFFMLTQMLRTTRTKRIFLENEGTKILEKTGPKFNIERMWSIARHCCVPRHAILISERRAISRITLLKSAGPELITGDQPVINLLEARNKERREGRIHFYYPISPSTAILIEDEGGNGEPHVKTVDAEKISELNKAIFENACEQVFSRKRETLEPLRVEGNRLF